MERKKRTEVERGIGERNEAEEEGRGKRHSQHGRDASV